jgi:hypothetical protein
MLTDPFNLANPNVTPLPGSPALTGGATPPNDGFFDVTATTPGALSDDPTKNWTANWTTYPSGTVGVEDNETQLVTEYRLEQNYPNPFNPSTVINFNLPQAAQVKLSVYNILGQEVAVLVDEFVNAGSYSKSFNAKNLTSGLYIYTLEAGSTKISKKMTLLK